jgi:hypothetical protein
VFMADAYAISQSKDTRRNGTINSIVARGIEAVDLLKHKDRWGSMLLGKSGEGINFLKTHGSEISEGVKVVGATATVVASQAATVALVGAAVVGLCIGTKSLFWWLKCRDYNRRGERHNAECLGGYAQVSAEVFAPETPDEEEAECEPSEDQVEGEAAKTETDTSDDESEGNAEVPAVTVGEIVDGWEIAEDPSIGPGTGDEEVNSETEATSANLRAEVSVRPKKKQKHAKRKKIPYVAQVALEAKAQVGLLSICGANRLIYQRICRDIMKEHGCRPTHIAVSLPMAVEACFLPLEEDIISARAMKGKLMTERRKLLGPQLQK